MSTGSYISIVLLWRGRRGNVTRVEGVVRVKRGGQWAWIPPSASYAENTIMIECTQESGLLQSMHELSRLWVDYMKKVVGGTSVGALGVINLTGV